MSQYKDKPLALQEETIKTQNKPDSPAPHVDKTPKLYWTLRDHVFSNLKITTVSGIRTETGWGGEHGPCEEQDGEEAGASISV